MKIVKFGQMVQEEMFFNMFLFLALVVILFDGADSFCYFGRGHFYEHSCEMIF